MKTRLSLMTLVVILLAACTAQAQPGRKYLTLGRDPKVPGGITAEQLKPGQKIGTLPYDAYVTGMYGDHSGPVSGWLKAGTQVVYREVQTRDARGRTIYAWKVEAAQPCGNDHQIYYTPAPSPPCNPEVRTETRYIPGPTQYVQVPGPERIVTRLTYPRLPRHRVPDVDAQSYMVSHQGLGQTLVRGAAQVLGAPKLTINQKQDQATGVAVANDNDLTAIQKTTTTTNTQVDVQTGVVVDNN